MLFAGASANRYLLSSYQSSGVVAGTGSLNASDISAARGSDGTIQATFVVRLAESNIASSGPTNIMCASPHSIDRSSSRKAVKIEAFRLVSSRRD